MPEPSDDTYCNSSYNTADPSDRRSCVSVVPVKLGFVTVGR